MGLLEAFKKSDKLLVTSIFLQLQYTYIYSPLDNYGIILHAAAGFTQHPTALLTAMKFVNLPDALRNI